MKRIYLIDCPGVVYPGPEETETQVVLKGVIRIENLATPEDHIPEILKRCKKEYICKTYNVEGWEDSVDFLEQVAKKTGKLLKHGEPDLHNVSKMVLNDWLHGKIPYFTMPPNSREYEKDQEAVQATEKEEELSKA